MPSPSPATRWALTPPFQPYSGAVGARAVCFLLRYLSPAKPFGLSKARELPGAALS
jgi:hypothetical protein